MAVFCCTVTDWPVAVGGTATWMSSKAKPLPVIWPLAESKCWNLICTSPPSTMLLASAMEDRLNRKFWYDVVTLAPVRLTIRNQCTPSTLRATPSVLLWPVKEAGIAKPGLLYPFSLKDSMTFDRPVALMCRVASLRSLGGWPPTWKPLGRLLSIAR